MSTEAIAAVTRYADTECTGTRHGRTQEAYRHGCRHPEAIAAHERWVEESRHACPAPRHHSNLAWLVGCRSDRAEAAHRKAVARKSDADRRRRGAEYARQYDEHARKAFRKTGGALHRDPRTTYRGGKMLVDRNNLRHLMSGFWDSPTLGEKIAAVTRMEGRVVPDSAFLSRLITPCEIAERLGMKDDREVYRVRVSRDRLRRQRTKRRLADAKWKSAVAAFAPVAKEQRRRQHEAAAERRLAWKWHCRTMRRLRESQERAKVVAMAIERRMLRG